ncbi:hypothetical protein DFR30_1119 [Thiogranum longum]|uniref:Uncharacterized protein n=1 Tax=Thiogranum longum TaxID=1537524 RepID=A0A4R1H7R2_9GAMM|nr:hypothetical protein DFR30_1119 [Thiogranum longum]
MIDKVWGTLVETNSSIHLGLRQKPAMLRPGNNLLTVMLFKRLLTAWFLVFTLMNSVAWAYAGHGDENHDVLTTDVPVDQDKPLPWQNDSCEDHCCHATAHVIGLIGGLHTGIAVGPLPVDPPFSDTYPLSYSLAPPYHPPIT